MTDREQLLDEARKFCDPESGEVLERVPDELMKKLREAKLARGVPGNRNKRTDSFATWYIFLNDDIREQVMVQWREANRSRKGRKGPAKNKNQSTTSVAAKGSRPSSNKGLKQFMQRRKTEE